MTDAVLCYRRRWRLFHSALIPAALSLALPMARADGPPTPDVRLSPEAPISPAPVPTKPADQPDRGGAAPPQPPAAADETVAVLGKKVKGPAEEDMGMVVDVLVDADSRPRAVVIDFGGFLGVGSRKIAVPWQALRFRPGERSAPLVLALDRAEVQAAPEYKPSAPPSDATPPPVSARPAPAPPAEAPPAPTSPPPLPPPAPRPSPDGGR